MLEGAFPMLRLLTLIRHITPIFEMVPLQDLGVEVSCSTTGQAQTKPFRIGPVEFCTNC